MVQAGGDLQAFAGQLLVLELAALRLLNLVDANGLPFNPTTYDEFRAIMEGPAGFVYAGWCGSGACEAKVKEDTKATIRVLPDEEFCSAEPPESCLACGAASQSEALWARAY